MFKEKLKEAIEKYIIAESPRAKSAAKGTLTRIVNSSTESNVREQIKEVLAGFDQLPELIKNRFTPGSLYREGNAVFGWYRENQVQAEAIPVDVPLCCEGYLNVLSTRDGFIESVRLPFVQGFEVSVPCKQTLIYAKYGYANPCSLQWHRNLEGYKVERSIISHGFWQAWKWWDGARDWYLEHRPELFEDFDWWGEPTPDCRIEPGSAVLGNKNKEFWQAQKFYLD